MKSKSLALMSALLCCSAVAAAEPVDLTTFEPYLMTTPAGTPPVGRVRLEADATFGARTTRVFGDSSIEERISGEATLLPWLSLRIAGGQAVDGHGERQGSGLFTEALAQLLSQRQRGMGIDVRIGVGFSRDYVGRNVPTARVLVGVPLGRVDLTAGAAFDFHPGASALEREPVDVTVSAALSARIAAGTRLGFELAGADLEGFVESEEAEGGARVVLGPTLSLAPSGAVYLRATAAAIIYATENSPVAATAETSGKAGFLGNLTLGYVFR